MAEHTALYRKYRPGSWEEVVGQDHVVATLRAAIDAGTIVHAYLFCGSRGTGKTSVARIFAQTLGTSDRDLYEIDAASNRGIDQIRALREEVHTLPFASPYKVYIIDEVHMLTKEAANALLKTLEEPPAHVIFILATTEQEKILDTIRSRCQQFIFRKPSVAVLEQMITRVGKKEGVRFESGAVALIALLADGSFRDAHGLLQQALSGGEGGTITAESVTRITGAPRSERLLSLMDAVNGGDIDTALLIVRELASDGRDMDVTLTLLLRLVRAVVVSRASPSLAKEMRQEFTDEEWSAIERLAKDESKRINSRLICALLDAAMRGGTTLTPELPLEVALLDHVTV